MAQGAVLAPTVADSARAASVVITCVMNDEAVQVLAKRWLTA